MLDAAYVSPQPLLAWSWVALGCGALLALAGLAALLLARGWVGRSLGAALPLLGGAGAFALAAYARQQYVYYSTQGIFLSRSPGPDGILDWFGLTQQAINLVQALGGALVAVALLLLAWAVVVVLDGRRRAPAAPPAMIAG